MNNPMAYIDPTGMFTMTVNRTEVEDEYQQRWILGQMGINTSLENKEEKNSNTKKGKNNSNGADNLLQNTIDQTLPKSDQTKINLTINFNKKKVLSSDTKYEITKAFLDALSNANDMFGVYNDWTNKYPFLKNAGYVLSVAKYVNESIYANLPKDDIIANGVNLAASWYLGKY